MKKIIFLFFLISFISSQKRELPFQIKLFSLLNENQNENICISPLSLYQILSLVSNGAVGKTQEEILNVLVPNNKINKKIQLSINANNQQIINYYNSKNKKVVIVNGISTKVSLKKEFEKICKKFEAGILPLINVEQINNWCSEKTNGKIKKIIDKISPLTTMILLNAVYFKVNWKYKFDEVKTKKMDFRNSNGIIVKVDTMYNEFSKIKYFENEKIQMIELPYEDDNLSMIILLPKLNKFTSSSDYLKKEKLDFIESINKMTYKKNVKLNLPKFELEYKKQLNEILQKMNMKLAFYNNLADFSNLSKTKSYIFQVIHSTYIKVDESGTESAAASLIEMRTNSTVIIKNYINMNVDHSFIYMIKDKRIKDTNGNNLLLFIGTVNNLKEENKK